MTLGKRTDYGDAKYAGLEVPFSRNVEGAVQEAMLAGFDFIVTPLVRPEHRPPPHQPLDNGALPQPFARGDVLYLGSSEWVRQVVGSVSGWVDADAVAKTSDVALATASQDALHAQLAWAAHLGLQAVLLPPPPHPEAVACYAQVLNQVLEDVTGMALWLTVPLTCPGARGSSGTGSSRDATGGVGPSSGDPTPAAAADGWQTWHAVRTLCGHDTLLGCVLQLGKQLPPAASLGRWDGEPVRALLVPASCFVPNKRGYPVLPKAHQEFITHMLSLGVQVVLTGVPTPEAPLAAPAPAADPTPAEAAAAAAQQQQQKQQQSALALDPATGLAFTITNPGESHPARPHWEYLAYLFRKLPELSPDETAEAEYRDYLQSPLQPLQDNLESHTYEVFEKDTIKYTQYEEAVFRALFERRAVLAADPGGTPQSVGFEDRTGVVDTTTTAADGRVAPPAASSSGRPPVVVMVVGAGRGPLVAATMRASTRAAVPVRVYAVEKNPNAVVHIQDLVAREGWQDVVSIVSADMRVWRAPEPADILVSELLGSFGDNELSPECLDGAQRFLAPGGISIPRRYTSFLAPVATHKLWTDVRAHKEVEHFETPYVVKLHRHHLLAPTQEMFTFVHPNTDPLVDNSRYRRTRFVRDPAAGAGIVHGFAGYFECELHAGVMLSTHPPTHTPNMASWFPIFFPLRTPIHVPAGACMEVHMWRCCGAHKVWYEWCVSSPEPCRIQNVRGSSYHVGL